MKENYLAQIQCIMSWIIYLVDFRLGWWRSFSPILTYAALISVFHSSKKKVSQAVGWLPWHMIAWSNLNIPRRLHNIYRVQCRCCCWHNMHCDRCFHEQTIDCRLISAVSCFRENSAYRIRRWVFIHLSMRCAAVCCVLCAVCCVAVARGCGFAGLRSCCEYRAANM